MNEQSISVKRFHIFDGQALPSGLVPLIVILILSQAAVLLMNQPAAYWLTPQYVANMPFGFLLQFGPVTHLIVYILYAGAIGLLLRRLNVVVGLPVAAALVFIHASGLSQATTCGFVSVYQPHTIVGCYAYNYTFLIMIPLVFILILLGVWLPERFKKWGKRILSVVIALWIFLLGYGVIRAAFPPSSFWRPLAPAHSPGPRNMAAIAYDTKRQRAVLFGGISVWDGDNWVYDNSTWEWDGTDWTQIDTPVAPSGRFLHAMAYDEQHEKVILYGGKNESGVLADLWEWDGVSWHRLCPVCNPAARYGHKMIFNADRQEIMLYGGQDDEVGYGEGWTWNGQSWSYFQFDETAPALILDPLVYSGTNKQMISFMGNLWGGTWVWKDSNWQKLNPVVQPPLRNGSVLIYDPLQNHSILFGGMVDNEFLFDDTWVFDGEAWVQIDTPYAPPQRSFAVAFYDSVRQSVILYGGSKFQSVYGDMWELVVPEGEGQ